jgi:hypothetical protein
MIRYGGRYLVSYIIASIVVAVVSVILAGMSINIGTGGGAAIAVAAASFTLDRLIKDKNRLPTSREYWSLVLITTAIGVVVEAIKLALFLNLNPALYTGNEIWGVSLLLTSVLIFVMNMFFYSKFMGRSYIKRRNAKRGDL